jgi:hypothetical protein
MRNPEFDLALSNYIKHRDKKSLSNMIDMCNVQFKHTFNDASMLILLHTYITNKNKTKLDLELNSLEFIKNLTRFNVNINLNISRYE